MHYLLVIYTPPEVLASILTEMECAAGVESGVSARIGPLPKTDNRAQSFCQSVFLVIVLPRHVPPGPFISGELGNRVVLPSSHSKCQTLFGWASCQKQEVTLLDRRQRSRKAIFAGVFHASIGITPGKCFHTSPCPTVRRRDRGLPGWPRAAQTTMAGAKSLFCHATHTQTRSSVGWPASPCSARLGRSTAAGHGYK